MLSEAIFAIIAVVVALLCIIATTAPLGRARGKTLFVSMKTDPILGRIFVICPIIGFLTIPFVAPLTGFAATGPFATLLVAGVLAGLVGTISYLIALKTASPSQITNYARNRREYRKSVRNSSKVIAPRRRR